MTRYERKLYFEQLMALRDAYRAESHESTGMTIEQAMTFAEQAFNDAVSGRCRLHRDRVGGGCPEGRLMPFLPLPARRPGSPAPGLLAA